LTSTTKLQQPWAEVAVDLDAGGDDLPSKRIFPPFLCFSLFHLRIFRGWQPEVASWEVPAGEDLGNDEAADPRAASIPAPESPGQWPRAGATYLPNDRKPHMSSPAPTDPPASPRKKSSRNAWLAVLVVTTALALTLIVFWQRLLTQLRSTRPEMLVLLAVAVWAATVLTMYLWQVVRLRRARGRARKSEELLCERWQRQTDLAVSETIELAAIATEWAVRAELVRDDFEDIQEYMQRLAKRPHIRRAFVARRDGAIIGAGDRRQRGKPIASLVPELPAESSSVQQVPVGERGMLIVVPVMGLESRLGTLVLEHERPLLAAGEAREIR
jgi:hypothetical protein